MLAPCLRCSERGYYWWWTTSHRWLWNPTNDGNEGEDDRGSEGDDCNNDQVPENPPGGLYRSRTPRSYHGTEGPQRPMITVAPDFMSLDVKCPIILVRDDEDTESQLLYSNDLMKSQWVAKEAKYHGICLTIGGDVHLWYQSITQWVMTGKCAKMFCRQFFKLVQTQGMGETRDKQFTAKFEG